jgi:hypothetical protein
VTKPLITVVVPTVPGRERSLERCRAAFLERSDGATLELLVIEGRPTCGIAWQDGADASSGDYIHFAADDHEPHEGWWRPAVEACKQDMLPCPVVYNPDGSVQSAGGDLNAPNCLRTSVGADWEPVPFTPVPFLNRDQWDEIGMVPLHYFTDVWVSERGRLLGFETVLRTGWELTHHNEPAGRGAGMDQGSRAHHDRQRYQQYMALVGAA